MTRPTKAVPIAITPRSRPTRSAQVASATHLRVVEEQVFDVVRYVHEKAHSFPGQ